MAKIFIIFFVVFLGGCSTSTTHPNKPDNLVNNKIEKQFNSLSSEVKKCFHYKRNISEIILYLNINSSGTLENITIIPLTNMPTQQCVSMILGSLRFSNELHKKYKVRKVLKL